MPNSTDNTAPERGHALRALAVVALVICLAILGSLGTWQARKFLRARATFALIDERLPTPVVAVDSAKHLTPELDFRRVRLVGGELWADKSVLVNRRFHDHQPGYWVATPYVFDDGSTVIVHRGWVPADGGLSLARDASLPPDDSMVGLVFTPRETVPAKLARESYGAGDFTLADWPLIGELDAALLYEILGQPSPPRENTVVVLGEEFAERWDDHPIPTHEHITDPYLTPSMHLGYAVTWYGSALMLIWLFWAGWTGRLDPSAR